MSVPNHSTDIDQDRQVKDLLKVNEDLLAQENYLKCVNEFAADLLKSSTLEDVLWIITTYLIEKFGFEDCVVYLLDEENNCLEKVASHSVSEPAERIVKHYIAIPVGEGIVGTVAKTGKPEIIHNTKKDPRYIVDDATRLSELTVPIISGDKVIGIIDSENQKENFYNQGHLETLVAISHLSAIKIDNLKVRDREMKHTHELERINSELERFVYHVTHDLKSPLANLQGMMFLVKEENDPLVLQEFYERMNISIKQMAEFIDEILSYSRNANAEIRSESVQLTPFIRKVIEAHRYQEHFEKIHFNLELQEDATIATDLNRLRVIMNNLISNAIKYYDPSKDQSSVSIRLRKDEDGVEIDVEDNGLGMTEAEKIKVFDMFYRIPRHTLNTSGTGVGLYILKETVNKLKGSIHLESNEGKGSLFTLRLPHCNQE